MTTDKKQISSDSSTLGFNAQALPWIITGALLLIYVLTLNHWVTITSLPVVAKIAEWDWRPTTTSPLLFVLTYPFRWLSGGLQLTALNFFSALCAALTLGLLARSVALLPHDRTREQRQRKTGPHSLGIPYAWLPPVIAAFILGFQLTFWEHAIAITGEMLDLLLFAYCIRCLLEFRISLDESWLKKLALVYGIGVTNNFAMLGFFPFFLVALFWIKGRSFFNFRFIARMVGFGAIGLSLYLLLPLIAAFSGNPDQTFFQTLRANFGFQKGNLFNLPFKQATVLRSRLFMMAMTSLLPLLMIGIRWPSFRGDISHASGIITAFMFRLIHLFFLAIGLWVFFDPKFSPRDLGFGLFPYLTFYYLTALAVGYFIGYALLVFGREPEQAWTRSKPVMKFVNLILLVAVGIGSLFVPVALARKNYPAIHAGNSEVASQYAKTQAETLPATKAVVLSDDSARLLMLRAAYAKLGKASDNMFLDTSLLPFPEYHRHLNRVYGAEWPEATSTNRVEDVDLLFRLQALSKTRPIYYLHPSFGYYFEMFYPVPHKLVYELKQYPTNRIAALSLTPEIINENRTFWNEFIEKDMERFAAVGRKNSQMAAVNTFYSRSLNYWGTELQKAKQLEDASKAFAAAYALNTNNVVAQINLQFNASLRKGEIRPVQPDESLRHKLDQFRPWQNVLTFNGPFDEPNFLLQTGEIFAYGRNLRQSAQAFMRVLDLMPNNPRAKLGLAKTYIELQRPNEALKIVEELRDDPKTALMNTNLAFEILRVEALSHLAKSDLPTAEKILKSAIQENPKDVARLGLLTQVYLVTGRYTNALETTEQQLKVKPNDVAALFTRGVLHMQMGQFTNAVATFNQILEKHPDNQNALLNRAISHLQSGNLAKSKEDYESLAEEMPESAYQVYYGLAQIAEKQKNNSEALKNYKIYLEHAPTTTAEFQTVQKRVAELEK